MISRSGASQAGRAAIVFVGPGLSLRENRDGSPR
jgi:hypothetical protein